MADSEQAPKAVDSLITEKADSAFEFPTSDHHPAPAEAERHDTGVESGYRAASQAWDEHDGSGMALT